MTLAQEKQNYKQADRSGANLWCARQNLNGSPRYMWGKNNEEGAHIIDLV